MMHQVHGHGALLALGLLVFLGLSACGGGTAPPEEPPVSDTAGAVQGAPATDDVPAFDTAAAADTAKVVVEDFQFEKLEDGTRVFTGVLYNPTSEPITVAQIQIALYNANNVRVGKARITVEDVPPGERKPFRQPLSSDQENIEAADVRSVLMM